MKITKKLKDWAIANCEVEKDAEDSVFQVAIGKALGEGALTGEKFAELSAEEKSTEVNEFTKKMDSMADGLSALVKALRQIQL